MAADHAQTNSTRSDFEAKLKGSAVERGEREEESEERARAEREVARYKAFLEVDSS